MTVDWVVNLAAAAVGYVLGSIPFGLVITKLAGLGDIRKIGSGNIGATNVLRTGRRDLALATLLLDIGKAGLAFLICWQAALAILIPNVASDGEAAARGTSYTIGLIGGAMAFIGHCFPVWLKFKGGKGVATYVGLLFASSWQLGLAFGIIWLALAAAFRMSSFAALIAALAVPFIAHFLNLHGDLPYITGALTVLIWWRHRANIKRIIDGTEPKIGKKKEAAAEPAPPGSPG
jgi:acyl phosphate:glycerol-3-phosphate acyltransferase